MASPFSLATRISSASLMFFIANAILARFLLDQLAADFDGALALMHVEPVLDLLPRARRLGELQPVAAGIVPGLGKDLDDVARAQLVAQRNDAAVDLGADAGVSDLGVHGVGKIDRRGVARQHHDPALGREGVHLFRIEIDLERGQELVRVLHVALPLDHLAQPCQPLLVARRNRTVLVLPVRCDAFLGHLVHLFGADLHLEGMALFGDDRGVQRLVEVVARDGDEVLDAPRHRPPLVVNDAQHGVAIGFRLRDDAQRQHVVNLVDRDALPLQLLPDAVHALDARFHPRLDLVLAQLLLR